MSPVSSIQRALRGRQRAVQPRQWASLFLAPRVWYQDTVKAKLWHWLDRHPTLGGVLVIGGFMIIPGLVLYGIFGTGDGYCAQHMCP